MKSGARVPCPSDMRYAIRDVADRIYGGVAIMLRGKAVREGVAPADSVWNH